MQDYEALGVQGWMLYGHRDVLQVIETQTAMIRTESPERPEGFYHETRATPETSRAGPEDVLCIL